MIVPILLVIFVITFLVVVIVKRVKESIEERNIQKAKIKEQREKLNSVIPGTILRKEVKVAILLKLKIYQLSRY